MYDVIDTKTGEVIGRGRWRDARIMSVLWWWFVGHKVVFA